METLLTRPLRITLRRALTAMRMEEIASSEEALERGITEIEAALHRLGVEAAEAEAQGIRLAEAFQDPENFQKLSRLHAGVKDILTMALPKQMETWTRQQLKLPTPPVIEEIQLALGALAVSDEAPRAVRGLARVLLFQGIRLNVLVAEHLTDGAFIGAGIEDQDINDVIEASVDWWTKTATLRNGTERPLHVLLASALLELGGQLQLVGRMVSRMQDHLQEDLRLREQIELKLREMNAPDSVLIRNVIGPMIGEQRLRVERLQGLHATVLGGRSRAALDKQRQRVWDQMKNGESPTRQSPALIDLVKERLQEGGQ